MSNVKVVIPFRLRDSGDMRRSANLATVLAWWWAHGVDPVVQSDGLDGDAQFNRHRAYNLAVERFPADVYVFSEADMLIPMRQVMLATRLATRRTGLVVPFTQYRYLSDETTAAIRDQFNDDTDGGRKALAHRIAVQEYHPDSLFCIRPESTMDNGTSIGAVNVVSRNTIEETGGFTEITDGNWYDDRIIEEGFAYLTGTPTQHIPGPAVHLYHLPGWTGDHLTEEDQRATAHNKQVLNQLRHYVRNRDRTAVKSLLSHRKRAVQ